MWTIYSTSRDNPKIQKTWDLRSIYQKELDKACFSHDDAYADSKDLPKRTVSDKIFKDKAYETVLNPKFDGYQRGLAGIVYEFFIRKQDQDQKQQVLAQKLHKPGLKIKKESLCEV